MLLDVGKSQTLNKSMRGYVDYCTGVKGQVKVITYIAKILKL